VSAAVGGDRDPGGHRQTPRRHEYRRCDLGGRCQTPERGGRDRTIQERRIATGTKSFANALGAMLTNRIGAWAFRRYRKPE